VTTLLAAAAAAAAASTTTTMGPRSAVCGLAVVVVLACMALVLMDNELVEFWFVVLPTTNATTTTSTVTTSTASAAALANATPSPFANALCATSRKRERPGFPGGTLFNVLHIQKAGGTSVKLLLKEWTRRSNLTYREVSSSPTSKRKIPLVFESMEGVVIGHTPWGLTPDSPRRRVDTVLMRSPVSRFVSQVNFYNVTFCIGRAGMHDKGRPECAAFRSSTLEKLLIGYRGVRLDQPALLLHRTNRTSPVHWLIHWMLHLQLSALAGFECWSVPPAYTHRLPIDWRAYYPPDRAVAYGYAETLGATASCTVLKMKADALAHLRQVDIISTGSNGLDSFVQQTRFHTDFVPAHVSAIPEKNIGRSDYKTRMTTPLVLQWLGEWLADEIDVYNTAVQLEADKLRMAKACL